MLQLSKWPVEMQAGSLRHSKPGLAHETVHTMLRGSDSRVRGLTQSIRPRESRSLTCRHADGIERLLVADTWVASSPGVGVRTTLLSKPQEAAASLLQECW
jgi:hypothetical protein